MITIIHQATVIHSSLGWHRWTVTQSTGLEKRVKCPHRVEQSSCTNLISMLQSDSWQTWLQIYTIQPASHDSWPFATLASASCGESLARFGEGAGTVEITAPYVKVHMSNWATWFICGKLFTWKTIIQNTSEYTHQTTVIYDSIIFIGKLSFHSCSTAF